VKTNFVTTRNGECGCQYPPQILPQTLQGYVWAKTVTVGRVKMEDNVDRVSDARICFLGVVGWIWGFRRKEGV
jgi:hypothetical protein